MPGWPGHTAVRRATKRVLAPLLNERAYSYIQAVSMARDIRSGALTEPEVELIPSLVNPGDSVLDIGANYGMWVYPLSRAVGADGRVWAFEPIPFTVSTLRKVTALLRLKNVEIVPKGCASETGKIAFDVPVQNNGAISGGQAHFASRNDARPGREQHARWHDSQEVTCEVVAIDEVVPEAAPVSLIKLDIEGAELLALRGCDRLLTRNRPTIVCEINPWFLEGLGLHVSDMSGFLSAKGYGIYRWNNRRFESVEDRDIEEGNYVFVHLERSDLLGRVGTSG